MCKLGVVKCFDSGGKMKENRVGLWVVCLFVLISLCGIRDVQAQDVFRDIDQIKRDISDLKNEISDLRNQLFGLRQAILKSVASQDQQTSAKLPRQEDRTPRKEEAVDEKELTNSICQAVGKFFGEAEAVSFKAKVFTRSMSPARSKALPLSWQRNRSSRSRLLAGRSSPQT